MATDQPPQNGFLKKLDLFFAVITKAFLALAVTAIFLVFVLPENLVEAGKTYIDKQLKAAGVDQAKFQAGPIELSFNPKAFARDEANLQGAMNDLQEILNGLAEESGLRANLQRIANAIAASSVSLQRQQAEVTSEVARASRPLPKTADPVRGWLYAGLVVNGKLVAPAQGIELGKDSADPLAIKSVVVTKDSPILDNIDTEGSVTSSQAQLVKAGTPLTVEATTPQKTISSGSLIWVKVTVPPERVLQSANK